MIILLIALYFAGLPFAQAATLPDEDRLGGRVEARIDGRTYSFPVLKTDIEADIQGDLATVTVIQTFANPLDRPLHARYLFPLNKDAAVFAMTMEVGEETVLARIRRIEEARAEFESAKAEGRSAALLTQHRPNMFTQDIANLMPGLPIRVSLRYVQTVPKVDGAYELVAPLVVGPRFQPSAGGVPRWDEQNSVADTVSPNPDSKTKLGVWELEQLPAYPPVAGLELPAEIGADRVRIAVDLHAGMPIAGVQSPSHPIVVEGVEEYRRSIALKQNRTFDNRDFVLRYTLAGASPQAGLLAYRDHRGGFFSLLIEPPETPSEEQISPREVVFVLDCSGSMAGLPIAASKAFMRQTLARLRPSDSFRIIRFSDAATEFSARALPATPDNVARGLAYTDRLQGSGGTVMSSGIRQSLDAPVERGAVRLVVFLTDGYIGNEHEILSLLREKIGEARLFAFGVGTAVNRYLLAEMGRIGRGFARFMDPTEDPQTVAAELAGRLQSPVLTDLRIDWGELAPTELAPDPIPDLFAGQSVRIQGRYARPGRYRITVNGKVNGRTAALPLEVDLPDTSAAGEAVALIWARSAIADAMHQMRIPVPRDADGQAVLDSLKERVVRLGLDYSLATRWTAFVAVSEKIYNTDPQAAETLPAPLPQVAGVSRLAYGNPTTAGGFAGGATPEPAAWMGLLMLMGLLGLRRPLAGALKNPA